MSRIVAFLVCMACCTNIAWAQDQDQVGLARYEGGGLQDGRFGRVSLGLTLSQGVQWRLFTLNDPMRLIVDFREVDWQSADPAQFNQSESVSAVRFGAMGSGWSRLVAELRTPLAVEQAWLDIAPETGKAQLNVTLDDTDEAAFAAAAGAPKTVSWGEGADVYMRAPTPKNTDKLVVILDPGHGGIDPGAQRDGVIEADLMLSFARELREILLRTGAYDVYLTRDSDQFVSLEARVSFAHQAGADLFVSLHADALDEGVAHGASVYTLAIEASDAASAALAERHDRDDLLAGVDLSGADDRVAQVLMDLARLDNTPRSQALAEHLIGGIRNATGHVHKRPVRQAGFSVLKAADIPSVLIELGFLSTNKDLENLQDPIWRAAMAAGIRDGIAAWALEDAALSRLRRQ